MRISVVMAVRNGERYLEPLLESLARQTRAPHELVVTDDASDDATPALLESFAANAPFPVRVDRFEQRRGHVEAFIAAARRCEGDAIAFCDADDVWLDHKLERCGGELEATGAVLVIHATRLVDAELRAMGHVWPPIAADRLVPRLGLTGREFVAPGVAMVFRSELLDVADFATRPLSRYGHDRPMLYDEWVIFLATVVGPVRLLAEPLVLYRRHGANDSSEPTTARRRLTLRPPPGEYREAAGHTAGCAAYLERAAEADGAVATRLVEAAAEYRRASLAWQRRAELYATRDRRLRLRLVRGLLAAGAYGPRTAGGLGRAALGKDLAAVLSPRPPAPR